MVDELVELTPIDWSALTDCYWGLGTDVPGITCQRRGYPCLEYSQWCSQSVYNCPQLNGRSTADNAVCGNHSFWHNKTCRDGDSLGVRCSSHKPGQCFYPHSSDPILRSKTCDDGSNQIHTKGLPCPSHDLEDIHNCKESCLNPSPVCTACSNPTFFRLEELWMSYQAEMTDASVGSKPFYRSSQTKKLIQTD